MSKRQPLVSVIIPVYNESKTLEWLHGEIARVFDSLSMRHEVIFVDDGSQDDSLDVIQQIVAGSSDTHFISFSRNFGKEAATSAGLHNATGDAAIIVDADGQNPPELIPEFVRLWQGGHKVVVGVRRSNQGEGLVKKYGSVVFYKLLNALSATRTRPASTDFRLLDRVVIDAFNTLTERGRITRGLIDWLGFDPYYIEFDAPERKYGKAAYNYNKLFGLALHAFVSNSTKPLLAVGFLGFFVMIGSAILGASLFTEMYLLQDPLDLAISGTAILAVFLSFLVGVVLFCQGLLALYIESIHNETQNRPLYVIKESSQPKVESS